MYELIIKFLKAQNWQFSEVEKKDTIFFGISGKNGNFQCSFELDEEDYKLTFYSICGSNVPSEKRHDILVLLNQLNVNLTAGNFQMDDEGELRLKIGLIYFDLELQLPLIENIVFPGVLGMDAALPGLMGYMFSDLKVSDAFEMIRNENLDVEKENNDS